MHEDRILSQRQHRLYRGPLARNVEYLLTFAFAFAMSPRTTLHTIPVKSYGRYLVDYVDDPLRRLWAPDDTSPSF